MFVTIYFCIYNDEVFYVSLNEYDAQDHCAHERTMGPEKVYYIKQQVHVT